MTQQRATQSQSINRTILNNVFWFIASVVLAFFIWVVATTQADPIVEERLNTRVPIQVQLDEGMTVVEQQTSSVWVTVRTQRSIQEELTPEDVTVIADLRGYEPGTHTVELETELTRRGAVDTQPLQITVTIGEVRSQQVPVEVHIPLENELPPNYTREEPQFSESQVLVRGVASRVQEVVAAQATLDLGDQREILRENVRLVPVDASGQPVMDVEVEPPAVEVVVPIRRREDLREVSVSPNINPNTLPEGYTLTSFSYSPQTIFLVGSRQGLEQAPNTVSTERIDLSGRTDDFETSVPVVLPEDQAFSILGDQTITVSFKIDAQMTTAQFEDIALETVGLSEGLQAQPALDSVVVLVTGPQPVIRDLTAKDVRVVVDLNGLSPGTHELTPQATIAQADINPADVSVNPATVTVTVTQPDTPEATPEVTPQGG